MGADENQRSQVGQRKFSDDIFVRERPRVNSVKTNLNLKQLRRHSNVQVEDMPGNNIPENTFHHSLGFPTQNNGYRIPRRLSESYCLDFKNKYASGKLQDAVLKNFAGSVMIYNN